MSDLLEMLMEWLVFPLFDLKCFYKGDKKAWIKSGLLGLGSFAFLALAFVGGGMGSTLLLVAGILGTAYFTAADFRHIAQFIRKSRGYDDE